jgi:hypothetical protein
LGSFHEYLRSDELIAINSTLGLTRPGARTTRAELHADIEVG